MSTIGRDETIIQEWARRQRRQVRISGWALVSLVGFLLATFAARALRGGGVPRGALIVDGLFLLLFGAAIPIALVLSWVNFRCPKCRAYQGRYSLTRRACRSCHVPLV